MVKSGWFNESKRHSLASRGIKTAQQLSPSFFRPLYEKNQGLFYRGVSKNPPKVAYLGEGLYITWDKGMAKAFSMMGKDGKVLTYKLDKDIKLLDAQSKEFYDIKRSMGVDPQAKVSDPVFARLLAFEVQKRGYDGVISDEVADGIVIFKDSKAKLVRPEPMHHKQMKDDFLKDIDIKNSKIEYSYDERDGKLEKQKGTETNAVFGLVTDEFTAKDIKTIHNHPDELPPSDKDILSFLFSGRHSEDTIVLPSGKYYKLIRTPNTSKLTHFRNITKEESNKPHVIETLNKALVSSKRTFGREYNDIIRHLISKGITDSGELQKQALYIVADRYDFKVETGIAKPK